MADSSKYLRDGSGDFIVPAPHPDQSDTGGPSIGGFDSSFSGPTGPDKHITSGHDATGSVSTGASGGGGFATGGSKHIL